MLKAIEGVYRNGHVELLENPEGLEESRVIVTFMPSQHTIDLRERGLDEAQAADLRGRLLAFEEDWNRPEMDIYDAL